MKNKGKADFSPQSLFQVILLSKQIKVALQLSSGFQRNYPKETGKGLPTPDFFNNHSAIFQAGSSESHESP